MQNLLIVPSERRSWSSFASIDTWWDRNWTGELVMKRVRFLAKFKDEADKPVWQRWLQSLVQRQSTRAQHEPSGKLLGASMQLLNRSSAAWRKNESSVTSMPAGRMPNQACLITVRVSTIESAGTVTLTNWGRWHLSNFALKVEICLEKRVKSTEPCNYWLWGRLCQ